MENECVCWEVAKKIRRSDILSKRKLNWKHAPEKHLASSPLQIFTLWRTLSMLFWYQTLKLKTKCPLLSAMIGLKRNTFLKVSKFTINIRGLLTFWILTLLRIGFQWGKINGDGLFFLSVATQITCIVMNRAGHKIKLYNFLQNTSLTLVTSADLKDNEKYDGAKNWIDCIQNGRTYKRDLGNVIWYEKNVMEFLLMVFQEVTCSVKLYSSILKVYILLKRFSVFSDILCEQELFSIWTYGQL